MKKIITFVMTLGIILTAGIFVGCGTSKVDVDGLSFTYEKNSVQKTTAEEQDYIQLKLNIKNTTNEDKNVTIDNFTLKQGEEIVSDEIFFGNNIIDKMDNETLQSMKDIDLVLNITLINELTGEFKLYYNDTLLVTFNL